MVFFAMDKVYGWLVFFCHGLKSMAGWFLLPWIKPMVGWFFFAMDLIPWLDGFCCHG